MHKSPNQIDVPEADYLYIQTSQIPNTGNGLHTAIHIYKDEIIALYGGEILKAKEAKLRVAAGTDAYFIMLLNGTILDSQHSKCFARYANDTQGSIGSNFKNNAKISLNEKGEVCLVASRKIKAGEEIFCAYGKRYWEKKLASGI